MTLLRFQSEPFLFLWVYELFVEPGDLNLIMHHFIIIVIGRFVWFICVASPLKVILWVELFHGLFNSLFLSILSSPSIATLDLLNIFYDLLR